MPQPQVVTQPTSRELFGRGFNLLADLLAPTLGPTGGHVVAATDRSEKFELLDDAATTVRRLYSLGRRDLDIGAMTMRGMVWRVGQRVGDGGATAALLARALFVESQRLIAGGANAMRLGEGIRRAAAVAVDALHDQARPIYTEDELAAVARTVTGDPTLAALLGEMSYLLGPDAHVNIEKYVAPYFHRRYVAGAHFPAQIVSSLFYTDAARKQSVLAAPAIAVLDESLNSADQAVALLEAALSRGAKALVVIAREIGGAALNVLAVNQQAPKDQKKLDLLAVKLTAVGDDARWTRSDLALLTGATVLGPEGERSAERIRPTDLGQAQRAEFANKALVLATSAGARAATQTQVHALRAQLARLPLDDDQRPKVVRRLAALTGGVGELKVGAYTEAQRTRLEAQAERALKVLSAAQRGGVVAGGGAALLHCAPAVRSMAQSGDEDVALGGKALAAALAAPLRQILVNSGVEAPGALLHRIAEAGAPATFDALQGKTVNAFASGVLDVADVTSQVLQIAVSGALMGLSTDAIVFHRKPQQSFNP